MIVNVRQLTQINQKPREMPMSYVLQNISQNSSQALRDLNPQ